MGRVSKKKKSKADTMRAVLARQRSERAAHVHLPPPPPPPRGSLAAPHDSPPAADESGPSTAALSSPLSSPAPSLPSQDASQLQITPPPPSHATVMEETLSSHQKRMKMMQGVAARPQGHFSKRYVISEEQLQAITSKLKCPNMTCRGSVKIIPTTLARYPL